MQDERQGQRSAYLVDKKYTEATRYYREVGKTPEEVKNEREKMRLRGADAFKEVLREKQKKA